MNRFKRLLCILLLPLLICLLLVPEGRVYAQGEQEAPENGRLHVNGKTYTVKLLNVTYTNNTYVSLRDMASALSGTDKQFDVSVSKSEIIINTGIPYGARGGENEPFDEEVMEADFTYNFNLKTTPMFMDDVELKRFTLVGSVTDGVYDCFINVPELAMMLDTKMTFDNDELYVDTSEEFSVNMDELEEDEFFMASRSCLLADATTGEILYEYEPDRTVLIASTSKLMTYLLVMDAISEGKIGMYDTVYISDAVSRLSYGEDGVVRLDTDLETNVNELIKGMLLASSNECAMALAEYVAGTEAEFVKLMNAKAESLGLSESTRFYNSNGLPTYTDDVVTAKVQNRSTANDMFTLVKYLLAVYPQVTEITSMKEASLPSMGFLARNTNPLLYNVKGTIGLKTGTTNGAMCCLISAKNVTCGDGDHILVSLVFGAESNVLRSFVSEILLDYGTDVLTKGRTYAPKDPAKPQTAEELVQAVLKTADRKAH